MLPQARCQLQHLPTYDHPPRPQIRANGVLSRGPSPQSACNTIVQGYNSLMRAIVAPEEGSYSYAGTGYANPHAVSQIANGQSTTTYSYDQNGNLTQKSALPQHIFGIMQTASPRSAPAAQPLPTATTLSARASSRPRPRRLRSIPSSGTPSRHPRAAAPHTRRPRSTCSMVIPCLYHRPAIRERRSDRLSSNTELVPVV